MKDGSLNVVEDATSVFGNVEMFERWTMGDLSPGDIAIFLGETNLAEFFESGPPGSTFETNIVKVVMIRVLTKFGVGWIRQNSLERQKR